jgi:protoheme IX farnesyltransferase
MLTKPTIMLLVVITGASALVMEQQILERPLDCLLILLALFMTGGAANALNQFFERDIDAQMDRTRNRRPLPRGEITHRQALAFAIGIGTGGVALLALRFNVLSAVLGLVTILFYGLFYTLWLKPNTAQNIVIGGAAGAMAPVIAWAAAANTVPTEPWLLFLIVFLWTPPHFWALALYRKADYERVKLPMMPVVAGDDSTLTQMLWYTIALVIISLTLAFYGTGWLYLTAAIVLGGIFLQKMVVTRREKTRKREINLFLYSIVYLLALFSVIILEGLTGLNTL